MLHAKCGVLRSYLPGALPCEHAIALLLSAKGFELGERVGRGFSAVGGVKLYLK